MAVTLGILALISLCLTLWQWRAGCEFPLHRRISRPDFTPPVTLLKPLKGIDSGTAGCLRSWLTQDYPAPVQILFGVSSESDPVSGVVRSLIREHPGVDARLVVCPETGAANAKAGKLAHLETLARHEVVVISDADVLAPPDLLVNVVAPLRDRQVGLVNCLYRHASAANLAMALEAVAANADFWSQVLQGKSIQPMDFALGAVMATRREQLAAAGGFKAIANHLADDYQLGHRIHGTGRRIELCPVVVECHSGPMTALEVWNHQLRWARTIRSCKPAPYFFSLLGNGTLWPVLWLVAHPTPVVGIAAGVCLLVRVVTAEHLQRRLLGRGGGAFVPGLPWLKDLLQAPLWAGAFLGNRIEWRGSRFRVNADGTLSPLPPRGDATPVATGPSLP